MRCFAHFQFFPICILRSLSISQTKGMRHVPPFAPFHVMLNVSPLPSIYAPPIHKTVRSNQRREEKIMQCSLVITFLIASGNVSRSNRGSRFSPRGITEREGNKMIPEVNEGIEREINMYISNEYKWRAPVA
ncbi:hypothetical protein VTL71DRAFT_495 [Oculimacula yallundae]|uniref:Uncharacterized protein n=1 Tax=Oculimacula yallundae TaxID=86028 RepID=A0ABR4D082_9HELO